MEGHPAPWDLLLLLCVYNSEQYSAHFFRISCSSVKHFPASSRMAVVLVLSLSVPSQAGRFSCCCFSAGFLRYLGIVLQSMSPCFPHAFFFFFFETCRLASLYSSASSVFFFCLSSLRLSHGFSMSSMTQGWSCLPGMSLTILVTAVFKLLIKVSRLSRAKSGANFPQAFWSNMHTHILCTKRNAYFYVFNFMKHLIFRNLQNQNCKKVICNNVKTVGCQSNQTVQILSPLILQALHCQHGKSVPGVASICLDHCPASARHGGYQVLDRLSRDGLPILLQHRKQFIWCCRGDISHSEASVQFVPQMFYWA